VQAANVGPGSSVSDPMLLETLAMRGKFAR
jgi:hypothetical protein